MLNARGEGIAESRATPEALASILRMVDRGPISGKIAKVVLEEVLQTGRDPDAVVREKGLLQISDEGELAAVVDEVIAQNPSVAEDYRGGKEKALGFLVGQVMKATKGRANPGMVNELLRERLRGG